MPFTFFVCNKTGEKIVPNDCLACAHNGALPGCNVSPAILYGIMRNQRPVNFARDLSEEKFAGKIDMAVSVTELLGCPRKRILQDSVEWGDSPAKMYWSYRGTLFHREAESYAQDNPYAVAEMRLFWFAKNQGKVVAITGQPDLLILRNGKIWILDYKTIKSCEPGWDHICKATGKLIYNGVYKCRGKTLECRHCSTRHPIEEIEIRQGVLRPKGHHLGQIQLYALLLEKNWEKVIDTFNQVLHYEKMPLLPTTTTLGGAELVYLDMSEGVRVPVNILPQEDRIRFLKERLALHLMPQRGTLRADLLPAEDGWQCSYCPVVAACKLQNSTVAEEMTEEVIPD